MKFGCEYGLFDLQNLLSIHLFIDDLRAGHQLKPRRRDGTLTILSLDAFVDAPMTS